MSKSMRTEQRILKLLDFNETLVFDYYENGQLLSIIWEELIYRYKIVFKSSKTFLVSGSVTFENPLLRRKVFRPLISSVPMKLEKISYLGGKRVLWFFYDCRSWRPSEMVSSLLEVGRQLHLISLQEVKKVIDSLDKAGKEDLVIYLDQSIEKGFS